jgi:hypothetical protein
MTVEGGVLMVVALAATALTGCATERPHANEFGEAPHNYEQAAKEAVLQGLGHLADRASYVAIREPVRAYVTGPPITGAKVLWRGYEVDITYRIRNYVGYSNEDTYHVLFDGELVHEVVGDSRLSPAYTLHFF